MATKINNLNRLIDQLKKGGPTMHTNIHRSVTRCVLKVQRTAKLKFGKYQSASQGFPGWPRLEPSYARWKMRNGSNGDDPLIGHYKKRAGNQKYPIPLRASILTRVSNLIGYVGTNNPLGEIHEFGGGRVPPRPFLRPALMEEKKFIKDELKDGVARTLKNHFT